VNLRLSFADIAAMTWSEALFHVGMLTFASVYSFFCGYEYHKELACRAEHLKKLEEDHKRYTEQLKDLSANRYDEKPFPDRDDCY
jgi:hypothetical protein